MENETKERKILATEDGISVVDVTWIAQELAEIIRDHEEKRTGIRPEQVSVPADVLFGVIERMKANGTPLEDPLEKDVN